MRAKKASTTAAAVAYARGIGTAANPPDPIARHLLPTAWALPLRLADGLGRYGQPLRWFARAVSAGMVDHVNLRTAAIDNALLCRVREGLDQLLILGAGFDARAWRLPWLHEVDVFEVDHPATQAQKREGTGGLPLCARSAEFVAVDFQTQDLAAELARSGLNPTRATFVIWEGVTMYLPPGPIDATLGALAQSCAAHSVLAMTYSAPPLVPLPVPGLSHLVRASFSVLGEPLHGVMDPSEAASRLNRHGFTVIQDSSQRTWAGGRWLEPNLAYPFRSERLVEARLSLKSSS